MNDFSSVPSGCSVVYKFPDAAKFGKKIPKNKFYENAKLSPAIKKSFVNDVEKILWSYKLSPETINIPATDSLKEIQVFTIIQKNETIDNAILAAIDRAIPFPIIFILSYKDKIRYAAAYKRRNESDKTKWVISDYFLSLEYLDKDKLDQKSLPVVLDMQALYEAVLLDLIPLKMKTGEHIKELITRVEKLNHLNREIEKLHNRLLRTKQFNRKVELNTQIRKLKQKIEKLCNR